MENQNQPIPSTRCICVGEVAKKLSIGISTVWAFVRQDVSFPQPIHISTRITRWYEHEIDAFIASKRSTVH